MKTALLVIATGEKYRPYVEPLLESADKYFVEHTTILWTDGFFPNHSDIRITKSALGFPGETLHRYHTFMSHEAILRGFDQLFYADVDMLFVAPVKEDDIFSEGITATRHPGYTVRRPSGTAGEFICPHGVPETRKESTAFYPIGLDDKYYCGGFNGGNATAFLTMADAIRKNIDQDKTRGITAIWHDESHFNKYLHDNPPAKVLTPSFCYPEGYGGSWGWEPTTYKPVLLALDKRKTR